MLSRKTIGFLLKIGIVAFALFFLYEQLTTKSSIEQFTGTQPTNWQEFNQSMLQTSKVEKIVIVNKRKAHVYIKKEFLSEGKFKKVRKKSFGEAPNLGPHFFFEIVSVETFNNNLKEAQIKFDNEHKISPFYETQEDFFGDVILLQIKQHYAVLAVIILMMFLNWFLEALKWKFLISKIEKISIKRSIRAIFSGITVSAFTPNRVGEYGGRVFCLEKADRVQAVLITVIGSMAQLVTTIFFGCIGLLFLPKYSPEFSHMLNSIEFGYPILIFLLALLNILIVLLFLNASLFSTTLSKIKFLGKYKKYNEVFSFYNSTELVKVRLYSVARYAVFTTQFFIVLQLFDINIPYTDAIVLIMIMLFFVSIIPTIAITEIGVRGPVSIFLFGLLSTNTIGIFSATFVMWIINLLLPALIGTIFIFTLNFFRK